MFIHDNGKICVFVATRCGHTSMYAYFGIEPYTETYSHYQWIDSTSRKILVLRNPYQRIQSALNLEQKYPEIINTNFPGNFFVGHTFPYLKYINTVDFEYIDFDELNLYIPFEDKYTVVTNSTTSEELYVENNYYTKEDIQEEYRIYTEIKTNKNKITVNEWKYLTQ